MQVNLIKQLSQSHHARDNRRLWWSNATLALLLIVSFIVAMLSGSIDIHWSGIWHSFGQTKSLDYLVLMDLRLPRIIATAMVGAALAISGVIMQGMFRNPLADPGLLGMTSGASLAAILFILFFSNNVNPNFFTYWGLPISAFIGSLIVTWITYILSTRKGYSNLAILILSGVAINAICGAAIGLLTFMSNDNELRSITFWSMGSFANIDWRILMSVIPLLIISILLLRRTSHYLNAMTLGENQAKSMGVNIHRQKQKAVIIIAILVGTATSIAGPIGFVGLIIPHIMRFIVGANHRMLLPTSALAGALLLSFSDTIARTIISPAELPIGLITAMIGAPYFVYLLFSQSKKGML